MIAFQGLRPIPSLMISSGVSRTPTVTRTIRIKSTVRSQTTSGGARRQGIITICPMWNGCNWAGPKWDGKSWMNLDEGMGTLVLVHE